MQDDRGAGASDDDEPGTVRRVAVGSAGRFLERGGGTALRGGPRDKVAIEYVGKTRFRLLGEREFQYGGRTVGSSVFRYVETDSGVTKEQGKHGIGRYPPALSVVVVQDRSSIEIGLIF